MSNTPIFDESEYAEIVAMKMLLQQVTDEEFADEGWHPSFSLVRALYSYIDHLEEYVDWLEEQEF